jgi:hypothetical protein
MRATSEKLIARMRAFDRRVSIRHPVQESHPVGVHCDGSSCGSGANGEKRGELSLFSDSEGLELSAALAEGRKKVARDLIGDRFHRAKEGVAMRWRTRPVDSEWLRGAGPKSPANAHLRELAYPSSSLRHRKVRSPQSLKRPHSY